MKSQTKASMAVITFVVLTFVWDSRAGLQVYADRQEFLSKTLATNCTGALPNLGKVPGGPAGTFTAGQVTFSIAPRREPQWSLYCEESTPLIPGFEIGIDDTEDLNADFAAPVFSAGFDFAQPTGDQPGCPFTDSTFTVTLKDGAATVGIFTFNAPSDVLAFVGVWSDKQLTRMEIRETVGGCRDQYFGQFYSGGLSSELILTIRVSQVEICWNSITNATYQVQYRSDLTTNTWTPLLQCVPGNISNTCVQDAVLAGQPQRFYRVVPTNCVPSP